MSVLDPRSVREGQYRDSSNLRARGALHSRFSTNPYGWFTWVFDHLILPQGRILELGCGTGGVWVENRSRIPNRCRIVLSDLSPGMVSEAGQRLPSGSIFHFAVVDAQAIPFASTAFDVVIANHMLYHVPDLARTLSEVQRILKPDGRLYATTNGARHLQELMGLIDAFDPELLPAWRRQRDRRTFGLDDGAAELERWFSEITMYRYDDSLIVNEAEPLVAYVFSMAAANASAARRESFQRFVESRLAAEGPLHMTKDTGLFVAPVATLYEGKDREMIKSSPFHKIPSPVIVLLQ